MRLTRPFLPPLAALFAAGLLHGAALAADPCCLPTTTDFPKVGGNLGNQNYSSLARIHKGNIRQLGAAWMNSLEGGAKSGNAQSTAVAVDGVLFIETAQGRVHAVDGKTGAVKWSYNPGRGGQTRRGVAVGGGKVYTLTTGNYVIALDQNTGQVVWERQHNGYGNIAKVAVVYHDNMLYVGTNDGNRGAGLALRADNGDLVWHFFGAAAPGTIGGDTWEGETYLTGGATPWIHPAVDPELNLVYWTFGNARAGSSQNGSTRGGQNLFANSIVAMDAKTGVYKWHFQSVHHDIWDMDNVMAPVLADITVAGQPKKAVVYGSKTGMYYILDRRDGTPLLGIDEKPVPVDPRQKSWPTQPWPRGGSFIPTCPTTEGPARAVPNFKTRLPVRAALGRTDPVLPRPGRRRRLEPPVVQPHDEVDVHRRRLCRLGALADRSQQRPAPAGHGHVGRHRRRRTRHQPGGVEEGPALVGGARQRHPDDGEQPALHRPARRQPAGDGRAERPRTVALPDRRQHQRQPHHLPDRRRAVRRRLRRRLGPAVLPTRRVATTCGPSRSAARCRRCRRRCRRRHGATSRPRRSKARSSTTPWC